MPNIEPTVLDNLIPLWHFESVFFTQMSPRVSLNLQVDATDNEPTSFIYLSPDALSNPSKLLVLIQGNGVVRAGQWARRLIINQDLKSGTQIPFITRAMEVGDTTKELDWFPSRWLDFVIFDLKGSL